jgi:hypothetical protein
VDANDNAFGTSFPYVALPNVGAVNKGGGTAAGAAASGSDSPGDGHPGESSAPSTPPAAFSTDSGAGLSQTGMALTASGTAGAAALLVGGLWWWRRRSRPDMDPNLPS